MSLSMTALLAVVVLSTSFLSGIFGMAGGMILMGFLLVMMPLAPAMVLHGIIQMASNGWRAWLWRQHVQVWAIGRYAVGGLAALALFVAIGYVPQKSVALILLGLMPFISLVLPERLAPNAMRRGHVELCGAVCTVLSPLSGVSGPILDAVFVRSGFDRRQQIATKAAIQTFSHLLKLVYFGRMITLGDVPPETAGLAIVLAFAGTSLSRRVLDAMTDVQFRVWTRRLIVGLSAAYFGQGLLLAAADLGFDIGGTVMAAILP